MAESKRREATRVTEQELVNFLVQREKLKVERAKLKELERSVELTEESLIARIKTGASVTGKIDARVEEKAGTCRPAWKEEFIALAVRDGRDPVAEVEAVVRNTPVKTSEVLVLAPREALK